MRYGYGIAIGDDNITAASTHRILSLLRFAPLYEAECRKELAACIDPDAGDTIEDLSVDAVLDILTGSDTSIGPILQRVILEAEGIELTHDYDAYDGGADFLFLEPRMPWNWTMDAEKQLTEEKLATLLRKYIVVVSDNSTYRICYHDFN